MVSSTTGRGVFSMDQFVGQIIAVGFNFAPVGWIPCDGRLMPISQYDVLYTLIGTTFGGDGQTTFAVPDLRGRSPVGQGTGPGLSTRFVGEANGTESVTLNSAQIAAHTHTLLAVTATGTLPKPSGTTALATQSNSQVQMYGAGPNTVTLAPQSVTPAGGNLPHENRQPFNTVNYIIATEGIFPSRN
jgi:microcystin-dependent protein